MEATITPFEHLTFDRPIPLLDRWSMAGTHMLAARVVLHAGCRVAVHQHDSEQIAIVVSGRVKWIFGNEGREEVVEGGSLVHLPPNYPHGVEALEETLIFDILSPVGPMGVDSQKH